jgi:hypothetical protein
VALSVRAGALALAALLVAGAGKPAVKGWIAVETDAAGRQVFVAYASADQAFSGRYHLSGEKNGSGGTAKVQQGGDARLPPGTPRRLSHVSFGSLQPSDHFTVRLRLFEGDRLVGESELKR